METRARPTSRGRARCVSVRMGRRCGQTAAGPRAGACRLRRVGRRCLAPVGKGRCRCAYSTLFALRAKALQSGAPDFGVSREKSRVSERFAHQGTFPARRGTGERTSPRKGRSFSRTPSTPRSHNEPLLARNGDTRHLTVKTRPSSHKTFHIYPSMANAARYKPRLIAPAFRGEHPACLQPHLPALPVTASSPNHPAGRTAGSARTRPRDQSLGDPFLGTAYIVPVSRPPKRRRRTAPARGPSAVYALCRRARNETKRPSPLLMGLGRVNTEPKALAAGTAGTAGTAGYMTCKSMHFRYLVSGAAGRMG